MIPAADDPTEAITIRIPKSLKDAVDACAALRGTTVTGFIRDTLQDAVSPPAGRRFELPGFSAAFDEFLTKIERRKALLLVVNDRSGERYFFEGAVQFNLTNSSIVTLDGPGGHNWVLPRRDVVGWFGASDNEGAMMNKLAIALRQLGWVARVVGY